MKKLILIATVAAALVALITAFLVDRRSNEAAAALTAAKVRMTERERAAFDADRKVRELQVQVSRVNQAASTSASLAEADQNGANIPPPRWNELAFIVRYGSFATKVGLTNDEFVRLASVNADSIDEGTSIAAERTAAMQAGKTPANSPELFKEFVGRNAAVQDRKTTGMTAILGEDGMRAFSDFNNRGAVRDTVMLQFQPLFLAAGQPLTAQQTEQLVDLIRSKNPPGTSSNKAIPIPAEAIAGFTGTPEQRQVLERLAKLQTVKYQPPPARGSGAPAPLN